MFADDLYHNRMQKLIDQLRDQYTNRMLSREYQQKIDSLMTKRLRQLRELLLAEARTELKWTHRL